MRALAHELTAPRTERFRANERPMPTENAEAIAAWNGVLFDKFLRFRHLLTTGLAVHGEEALRRHPVPAGARVLDIGCGFGDTTLALAQATGSSGEAFGVDAAERFIELAKQDATAAGVENARFAALDVQTAELGGPYTHAFSRFGTMFFTSPVAALRNVARSLASGAAMTLVVWRKREENAWLHRAELTVRELVTVPEDSDEPTCGPGPFSMAGPDMVSAQLIAAGYDRIAFERFDADICIGRSAEEALDFATALGPAGEILRLAGEEGEAKRPLVREALARMLREFTRADGQVFAPSSTWIVTAQKS